MLTCDSDVLWSVTPRNIPARLRNQVLPERFASRILLLSPGYPFDRFLGAAGPCFSPRALENLQHRVVRRNSSTKIEEALRYWVVEYRQIILR